MQVIKQEQLAKAKGVGIIGLMVLVAATVHYWPNSGRAGVVSPIEPATVAASAPPAAAVPAPAQIRRAELQFRRVQPQVRRVNPQLHGVRPPAAEAVASEPTPMFKPDAPPIVTLTAAPGAPLDRPEPVRTASFVPTLAPPLAPPPARIVETQPTRIPQRSGALTVAARATGEGLAVAFQKTGAAFRRVF